MGQTSLDGTLVSGPPVATDNTFPSGVSDITIHTASYPKSWNTCTGAQCGRVNNVIGGVPWLTLTGIGPGDLVTEADFFYFRCDSELLVEVTQKVGTGTLVGQHYVQGPFLIQNSTTHPVVLVRLQGSATFEYHAEGQI